MQPRSIVIVAVTGGVCLIAGNCGDSGTGPVTGPNGTSLELVRGSGVTDTVATELAQALVVEVRGEQGVVATGTVVRFESLPIDAGHPFTPGVLIASLTNPFFGTFVADPADSRGRVSVLIKLGTVVGAAKVVVSAPEFGLQDTARFTVLPGGAARVVVQPKDTGLYAGRSFQSRATVTDQFGNPRSDPVTYSVGGPGLTVTSSGLITAGTTLGRTFYRATAAPRTDTGWVNVLPQGTLAAYQFATYAGHGPGIVVFNLDGSGYQWLGQAGGSYGSTPAWAPNGASLAFTRNTGAADWIYTSDLSGMAQPLVASVAGLVATSWPGYSPDRAYVYFSGLSSTVGNFSLWRAAADGSNPQQLYADPSGIAWRSTLSPDGTRLAFVDASQSPSAIQIYTVASQTVSSWGVIGQTPRWSPIGETIAFVAPYGGAISVMNSDGSGIRQVSPGERTYGEISLAWSPDGAWLVAQGPAGLELINVASGATLPLGFAAVFTEPAWKP